jgi:anti-sigma regulatory factor (Ser/Thr protein kinase)
MVMCINIPMARPQLERIQVRNWLIENLGEPHLASQAASMLGISRQTANRILNELVKEGLVNASGRTQARKYEAKMLDFVQKAFAVSPELKEDTVWRQEIAPHLGDLPPNVRDICQYGFTEMLNNVLSHSQASNVTVRLELSAVKVQIWIVDNGVGIFNNIRQKLRLDDEHHAILELCKGKLTTDPTHHSGEGVFFTSRMFDRFDILSHQLSFVSIPDRTHPATGDWLMDVDTEERPETNGTTVGLAISPSSNRVMQQVFGRFAAPNDNYGFTKTCIPVHLAKYGSEQLMSRSQAKRLLTRFERFVEVMLDFQDIELIGQAFADEIFRVYQNEHPLVHIKYIRASEQVVAMINRAKNADADTTRFLPGLEPTDEERRKKADEENNGSDDLSQDQI